MNEIQDHRSTMRTGQVQDLDGAALLDGVAEFMSRHVVFSASAQRDAVTLWTLHTHALDAFETTPRLAVLSAEKQSGKSRLLEVLALLCPAAIHTANISTPALFRIVESLRPTVLFDEIDAIFGSRGRDHEDLRALLNAGHRRGVPVHRCEGTFVVFCPVAVAGLHELPDTLFDRSILIRMQRRRSDEPVENFRRRKAEPEAKGLHDHLAGWAEQHLDLLRDADPTMPTELTDRAADVWEPLVAIADLAGGDWPERARVAAVELDAARRDEDPNLGIRLLEDLRTVFGMTPAHRMTTKAVTRALNQMTDGPWANVNGEPLADRKLAAMLRPYGIRPRAIRFPTGVLRGYEREQFTDAWERYLEVPDH